MKKILYILLLFINCILFVFPSCYSIGVSNGESFVCDNLYNYKENLYACIYDFLDQKVPFKFENNELLCTYQNIFTRQFKDEDKNEPFFELRYTNTVGAEFIKTYEHFYKKSYVVGDNVTKSFSFLLLGKKEFVSYIYNPNNYLNYTVYERKIECDYSFVDGSYTLSDLVGNNYEDFSTNIETLFSKGYIKVKEKKLWENGFKYTLLYITFMLFAFSIFGIVLKQWKMPLECLLPYSFLFILTVVVSVFVNIDYELFAFICFMVGLSISTLLFVKRYHNA